MTTNPPIRCRVLLTVAATLLAAGSLGCHGPVSNLQLVSYKDPYFPERSGVRLVGCAYRIDAGRDLVVAGRSDTHELEHVGPVTEYLQVRVFWKPHPGRTYADSTQCDALLRFVVASRAGTAVYTGTAFAYPEQKLGALNVALETARLRLESTSGDMPDLYGESRLLGTLVTEPQPASAAAVTREMELLTAR
jgi:hypothetical protein